MSFWGEDASGRKLAANVKICVDFKDAEGVYVVSTPVYEGESIGAALRGSADRMMDCLARDAGYMVPQARAFREMRARADQVRDRL